MTMTDLPQEFGVSTVQIDGHTKVRVTGEIDLATATEMRQRLEAVIAAGTGDLDLDLRDVTFPRFARCRRVARRPSSAARQAPPAESAEPIADRATGLRADRGPRHDDG
jgi:hypothetical protein